MKNGMRKQKLNKTGSGGTSQEQDGHTREIWSRTLQCDTDRYERGWKRSHFPEKREKHMGAKQMSKLVVAVFAEERSLE